MYTLLLHCVPARIESEYNIKEEKLSTNVKLLVEMLTKIENKLEALDENSNERRNKAYPSSLNDAVKEKSKSSTSSNKSADGPILRKQPRTGYNPSLRNNCKPCDEYEGYYNTHATNQCRKYDHDDKLAK